MKEITEEELTILELKGLLKRDTVYWHGFSRAAPYVGISCKRHAYNHGKVRLARWRGDDREFRRRTYVISPRSVRHSGI